MFGRALGVIELPTLADILVAGDLAFSRRKCARDANLDPRSVAGRAI